MTPRFVPQRPRRAPTLRARSAAAPTTRKILLSPRRRLLLAAAAAALLPPRALACYIQGQDSGRCVAAADFGAQGGSFCASAVQYPACVPKEHAWDANHTLSNKDAWVAATFLAVRARRLLVEAGTLPPDWQPWEGGLKPKDPTPEGSRRFSRSPDCIQAYRNFLCWMNFPRCDAQGNSLELCSSVCFNYFRACNYPANMVRCYDPVNYGAPLDEVTQQRLDGTLVINSATGLPILYNAPYPGHPFRPNLLVGGREQPVCTPALTGGATRAAAGRAAGAAAAAAALAALALARGRDDDEGDA